MNKKLRNKLYIFLLFIIIIVLLYIYYKNNKESFDSNSFPKKIWLLWFQGWKNAPEIVQNVKESWILHNPNWEIILLDDNNIKEYVKIDLPENAQYAAKSDIIRLYLLKNYGGIWSDATMPCIAPIDTWIYDAVERCQFFMYHGRDKGRGPASWFICSYPNNYIITKWCEKTEIFWKNTTTSDYEYLWMDKLFAELCLNDEEFLKIWKNVPYKYAISETGPHCVFNVDNRLFNYDKNFLEEFYKNPPFAVKLSHKGGNFEENTNGYFIMKFALKPKNGIKFIEEISPSYENADFHTFP